MKSRIKFGMNGQQGRTTGILETHAKISRCTEKIYESHVVTLCLLRYHKYESGKTRKKHMKRATTKPMHAKTASPVKSAGVLSCRQERAATTATIVRIAYAACM